MIAIPDGMDMVMERTNTRFTPPGRIHPCLPKYTSPAMDDKNEHTGMGKGPQRRKQFRSLVDESIPVEVSGNENPMGPGSGNDLPEAPLTPPW